MLVLIAFPYIFPHGEICNHILYVYNFVNVTSWRIKPNLSFCQNSQMFTANRNSVWMELKFSSPYLCSCNHVRCRWILYDGRPQISQHMELLSFQMLCFCLFIIKSHCIQWVYSEVAQIATQINAFPSTHWLEVGGGENINTLVLIYCMLLNPNSLKPCKGK